MVWTMSLISITTAPEPVGGMNGSPLIQRAIVLRPRSACASARSDPTSGPSPARNWSFCPAAITGAICRKAPATAILRRSLRARTMALPNRRAISPGSSGGENRTRTAIATVASVSTGKMTPQRGISDPSRRDSHQRS